MSNEYKIVPVKPTPQMLEALSGEWHSSRHADAENKYAAMLAVAPSIETDREAIRNSALEDAAKVCDYHFGLPECPQRAQLCAEDIRAMISQPELKPDVEPDFYLWGDEVIWKLSPEMNECIRQQGTPLFEHPPLKSQPAQPSDSRTEFSDTEMLDWLIAQTGTEIAHSGGGFTIMRFGKKKAGIGNYPTPREAIKAAMRADREDK